MHQRYKCHVKCHCLSFGHINSVEQYNKWFTYNCTECEQLIKVKCSALLWCSRRTFFAQSFFSLSLVLSFLPDKDVQLSKVLSHTIKIKLREQIPKTPVFFNALFSTTKNIWGVPTTPTVAMQTLVGLSNDGVICILRLFPSVGLKSKPQLGSLSSTACSSS